MKSKRIIMLSEIGFWLLFSEMTLIAGWGKEKLRLLAFIENIKRASHFGFGFVENCDSVANPTLRISIIIITSQEIANWP